MLEVLGTNSNGHIFYQIAMIAAVILLSGFKGQRKTFVIPAVIMGIIIVNPVFKDIWINKLHLGYYWRILWIVPVIPLCATLPVLISRNVSDLKKKTLIVFAFALIFALTGTLMYGARYCEFDFPTTNYAKLPQDTVEVAEYMLNIDDNPRVIADRRISIYIRQYAGEIDSLFGRDVDGYIYGPSQSAVAVNEQINNPEGDMTVIAEVMRTENFEYLIIDDTDENRKQQLLNNGFQRINSVRQWGIYIIAPENTEES